MAVIQNLKTGEDKDEILYPVTLTKAIFDQNGHRLDRVLSNVIEIGNGNNLDTEEPVPFDADTVNGHTVESDVPEDAKFTDTTYSIATVLSDGLMSKEDKVKLDTNNTSDYWDNGHEYSEDDYCIHDNILWKCKSANTNQTPVEGEYWKRCTITEELSSKVGYYGDEIVTSSVPRDADTLNGHDEDYFCNKQDLSTKTSYFEVGSTSIVTPN